MVVVADEMEVGVACLMDWMAGIGRAESGTAEVVTVIVRAASVNVGAERSLVRVAGCLAGPAAVMGESTARMVGAAVRMEVGATGLFVPSRLGCWTGSADMGAGGCADGPARAGDGSGVEAFIDTVGSLCAGMPILEVSTFEDAC